MDTKTSVLAVEGMTCRSCVAHVSRALRDVQGVGSVDVRLREGTVTVEHAAPVEVLIEALRDAGYASSAKP
jgi:copper chaperone CopZ